MMDVFMVVEVATGGAVVSAAVLAYGARAPRSSLFAPSAWQGATHRNSIALTFDDGPTESTPRVLEMLAKAGIRATFFQVGANARRFPAIAREVARSGHEIANHTDTHPYLHLRGRTFMREEIGAAQQVLEDTTGVRPVCFRAPYGVRWPGLAAVQRDFGLRGVTWSVMALDWKWQAAQVARRLLRHTRPGAILCLHDGRELEPRPDISVTLEALRLTIPEWSGRGLRFETVSEILCPTN